MKFRVCMSQFTSLICCDNIVYKDGKEPSQSSLLGFGSVRVLTKVRVRFGSSSSQVQKIWVRFGFGFGSYILSFEFCSVLYEFDCLAVLNLTVPQLSQNRLMLFCKLM